MTDTGVQGLPFDLVLKFEGNTQNPQMFFGEDVHDVLQGLLDHYGTLLVQINWFDSKLKVIVPAHIPPIDTASVTPQEGRTAVE